MQAQFTTLRAAVRTAPEHVADYDADGVEDSTDNCVTVSNALQTDVDDDTHGDACDAFPNDPGEYLDTDSDGIGNNADPDDDNDGLTDSAEAGYGTNSLLADTDGDGINDGVEITYATDPLDPGSFPIIADGDLAPLGAPDGKINAADILIGMRISLGLLTPGNLQLSHGDVYPPGNPDGNIGLPDILLIIKNALGSN